MRGADVPTAGSACYRSADFAIGAGGRAVEPALRQAAWYFRDEVVAVPRAGLPLAGFETGVHAFDDVRPLGRARAPPMRRSTFPPLVWVAAPQRLRHVRLAAGGPRGR